jgi:hopanoid C-2 methylase
MANASSSSASATGQARSRPIRSSRRKRVLIVNCYFPELRQPIKLTHEVPNALAPVMLGGAFSRTLCEVRLHNEVSHGFLEVFRPDLLSWPDMVVLTGLTDTFDRMLQITAYVRTVNPKVVVVAGGFPIRSLPRYSRQFFDYACQGDVEEIADVITEAFGAAYVDPEMLPRYDLANWMGKRLAYVESSRNCNFRCSFCTLTGQGRGYMKQSLDYLRRQIVGLGRRELLLIVDNQFHGADRQFFLDRLGLLCELRAQGHFRYWGGFATDAFFWQDADIALARQSGCISMLVGVESFDETWLQRVNKAQNNRYPQVALIEKCLDAGILFQYGLVFDPSERRIADMHRDLSFVLDTPEVPLPNFIFGAIPFPGTPFFRDRHAKGLLLPGLKVRDLEGSTLSMKPIDGIDEAAHFLKTAKNFVGYRRRAVRHQARFLWRYRKSLVWEQALTSTLSVGSALTPNVVASPQSAFVRRQPRTHVATTDRVDCVYIPRARVDAAFERYFAPTMITDGHGELNPLLVDDLMGVRATALAAG